ncbi:hypothetical protein SDC9_200000 [bioreactor metagenome]|uniref:Uncharacterized protein n=1 Tax=bioreactor metagenome TaxID=1076179 RepID=A0A645IVB2_9ZZZZ
MAERAYFLCNALGQLLQAVAQHFVIVTASGVDGDDAFFGTLEPVPFHGLPAVPGHARQIIHARRDHAHRAGN